MKALLSLEYPTNRVPLNTPTQATEKGSSTLYLIGGRGVGPNTISALQLSCNAFEDVFFLFFCLDVSSRKSENSQSHHLVKLADYQNYDSTSKKASFTPLPASNVRNIYIFHKSLSFLSLFVPFNAEAGHPVTPVPHVPFNRPAEASPYVQELWSEFAAVSMRVAVRGQSYFQNNKLCEDLFLSSEAANALYATKKRVGCTVTYLPGVSLLFLS